ncbi:MAG: maleylpyruvate isomerase N-terminal domain-containing protein [Bacteroidales bacterium]|nr:maleylpyruvate isomerase N-terminal domain-containing protein [Bacteroidales bacterium]
MKRIETLELFPELSSALLHLLKEISIAEWDKPSPIEGRTVKDLLSHLIDGSLRRLSIQRDEYSGDSLKVDIQSYSGLVDYIQQLNKEWMRATARLSPQIMLDLLDYAENRLYNFFNTLDPEGIALFPVQWAGEAKSKNWFDIAREYTEKWHHQMQIRIALNKPLLMDKRFTEPLYDTFMLGLPHLYRDIKNYPDGETIKIIITGNLNKAWFIEKKSDRWNLLDKTDKKANTKIYFSENDAWKIFTNTDRNKEKYKSKIKITGDKKLGYQLIHFVTVLS